MEIGEVSVQVRDILQVEEVPMEFGGGSSNAGG